jgi:uncharacterized protein (UPF0335 family)
MNEATRQVNNELDQGIQRIMRLHEEKKALAADEKEVKSELKAKGFDIKIVNATIKLLEMEDHDRQERDHLLDVYRSAAGIPRS